MPRFLLLLAALSCWSSLCTAQLLALANPGGPTLLEGLCDVSTMAKGGDAEMPVTVAVGWTLNGTYTYSYYDLSTRQVTQQIGKYSSWQCGTTPGSFAAIVDLTTVRPDGTSSTRTVCQYSEVYLLQGQMSWVQAEGACPTALPGDGSELTNTLYSLPLDVSFECGEAGEEWEGLGGGLEQLPEDGLGGELDGDLAAMDHMLAGQAFS